MITFMSCNSLLRDWCSTAAIRKSWPNDQQAPQRSLFGEPPPDEITGWTMEASSNCKSCVWGAFQHSEQWHPVDWTRTHMDFLFITAPQSAPACFSRCYLTWIVVILQNDVQRQLTKFLLQNWWSAKDRKLQEYVLSSPSSHSTSHWLHLRPQAQVSPGQIREVLLRKIKQSYFF